MENKEKNKKVEKTTKSIEFICSTYHWLPLEEQKKRAKEMEEMTKNNHK